MQRNRGFLIILAVASAVLALLLGFLLNVVSSFYIDMLRPYNPWIWAALGLVFAASCGVLIWQVRLDRSAGAAPAGRTIEQRATGGSEIADSAIEAAGDDGVHVQQEASKESKIKNSPITIK